MKNIGWMDFFEIIGSLQAALSDDFEEDGDSKIEIMHELKIGFNFARWNIFDVHMIIKNMFFLIYNPG